MNRQTVFDTDTERETEGCTALSSGERLRLSDGPVLEQKVAGAASGAASRVRGPCHIIASVYVRAKGSQLAWRTEIGLAVPASRLMRR